MARIKQNFFSGERPRVASHISKDYEAQVAENCDLSRGDLRPFKASTRIENLTETDPIKALYLWKKTGDDEWITHTSALDFVRSPIAGEAHDRVYVTGMNEPRVLTTSILSTPFDFTTDYYKLGVPAPAAALTIDAGYTPGSTYRAYIYTYVVKMGTTYSEEGSNSAIDSITDYGSGNVTLSGFTAPPTGRSIGAIRIYRTASSSSGASDFLYVGEFDTAGVNFTTKTFTDNVADASLGEAYTCENWSVPPTTLTGIISFDGGSLAGFVGNRVYVTEPYLPHAWPYSYPVDGTIVGLGHLGNTIVVLTDEFIYFLSGQVDAMSTLKLSGRYPCLSKQGIVSTEHGVIYPSDQGFVLVTLDGPSILSYDLLTRLQYSANYSPSSIRAAYFNSSYFAFHGSGGLIINLLDKTMVSLVEPSEAATPHVSLADNLLYYATADVNGDNAIYEFADEDEDSYMQFRYRSKDYILGAPMNFAAARVTMDLTEYQAINLDLFEDLEDVSGAVNAAAVNVVPLNYDSEQKSYLGVTFMLYGDGELLFTKALESGKPFRLPGDIMYQRCYWELQGDTPVVEIIMATSMEEIVIDANAA